MSCTTSQQCDASSVLAAVPNRRVLAGVAVIRTPGTLGRASSVRRHITTLITVAGLTALALASASAPPASARQDFGIDTGTTISGHPARLTLARIGGQIVRCDTGEGNLGGAGAEAPLTLPAVTTCNPSTPAGPGSAAQARQLEHDPLR